MALKGSLAEAGLPEILQLLAVGEKTGCLSITDYENFGHLWFRGGKVVFANLVNRELRLGERLLAEGRVSEPELTAAVQEQARSPERKLGQLLVEQGALSIEDLARTVADQIEETVYGLLAWERGYFHFEPGQPPPASEILVALDVSALLLEGARRADEWARIRRRIPHRRLVFARTGTPPSGSNGSPEAAAVWAAVDGRRDVSAVLAAARVTELAGLSALHELASAGSVRAVGESPPPREDGLRRREESLNLGVAFAGAGMLDEAAREFRQMLALDRDDVEARFRLGGVAFRAGRLDEARAEFARAAELAPDRPAAALNLALSLEALGRVEEAAGLVDELLERFPALAAARLHRAVLHVRAGTYGEALALLEGLRVDPELAPIAIFYRGMLHALHGDLRGARELFAGIPRERMSGRVLNNLGAVLERADRLEEARLAYITALELGAPAAIVRKNLGDLAYRGGRWDEARRAYHLALQEDPTNAEALSQLGSVALKEGRREEAIAYWEKALASDPGHERARSNLALLRPVGAADLANFARGAR